MALAPALALAPVAEDGFVWALAAAGLGLMVSALFATGVVLLLLSVPLAWFGRVFRLSAAVERVGTLVFTVFVLAASLFLVLWGGSLIVQGGTMPPSSVAGQTAAFGVVVGLAIGLNVLISPSDAPLVVARQRRLIRVRFAEWPLRTGAIRSASICFAGAVVGVASWNLLAGVFVDSSPQATAAALPAVAIITIALGLSGWVASRNRGIERTRMGLEQAVTAAYTQCMIARASGRGEDRQLLAGRLWNLESQLCSRVDAFRSCRCGSSSLTEVVTWLAYVVIDAVPDTQVVPHLSSFDDFARADWHELLVLALAFLADLRTELVRPTWPTDRAVAEASATEPVRPAERPSAGSSTAPSLLWLIPAAGALVAAVSLLYGTRSRAGRS
jgi:hypothetical protein